MRHSLQGVRDRLVTIGGRSVYSSRGNNRRGFKPPPNRTKSSKDD
ncbi:hypothetical protein [Laspinema palackyanum]